jgi:polysaccharide deacetylase 2 family uncharacterized protein YibQ
MVPAMAALSFESLWTPLRRTYRAPGRLAVIAWTIAAVGAAAALAPILNGEPAGAHAIVASGGAAAIAAPHAAEPVAAETADPAEFRRAPPPDDGRPRVAVIVRGLALSDTTTAAAIARLPPDVTLGLSPYGRTLQKTVDTARASGHEVFLDVPVEPPGYPANDAGPKAIVASLTPSENAERLVWCLERANGFPGLVFAPGSPALEDKAAMGPLLADPRFSGFVWAAGAARGLDGAQAARARIDVTIDAAATAHDIDLALERLEALARRNGSAIGLAGPYPVTVDRLAAWSADLESRGLQLVPASALSVSPAS